MLLLVSGATKHPRSATVGHLVVPRQRPYAASLQLVASQWAMDNGAFGTFDATAYMTMLERFYDAHRTTPCLFVTAPDVVGDADATLARWPFWRRVLGGLGYPIAFVLQDGIGTRTPWPECDAVFVGGTTAFKLSGEAAGLMGMAKAMGKWVHVGRVNSRKRADLMARWGADSYDGTSCSWYPDFHIPRHVTWTRQRRQQGELPL